LGFFNLQYRGVPAPLLLGGMLLVVFRENGCPEALFGHLFYEGGFIVVRASSTTAISSTVSP